MADEPRASIHSCMTPFSSSEHFVQPAIACSIELLNTVAEFLDAHVHTQTELGVVLEERVGPCGALPLVVGAVRASKAAEPE